jgi:uncharacterized membrane protein YjfL (UPF0719 family)
MIDQLFNTEAIGILYDPHAILYLVAVVAVLFVGKKVNDFFTPYNLNVELTDKDNKAIAVSFTGYLLALAIILWSVLSSESTVAETDSFWRDLGADILDTVIWGAVGIALLQVARIINDKALLYRFDNAKELAEDRNVGTGAVQFGSYVGSAFMVAAALSGGGDQGFGQELLLTVIYFFAGQFAFVLFGLVYQFATKYDLHDEIAKDNAAAGLSYGLTLVSVGLLLSGYLRQYDSLIGLALWFVIATIFLIGFRAIVDKIILPGSALDDEIARDRNWGAALIEGGCAIGLALLLIASF